MYKVISIISYILSGFTFLLGVITLFFDIGFAILFILMGVFFIFLGKYSWNYNPPKKTIITSPSRIKNTSAPEAHSFDDKNVTESSLASEDSSLKMQNFSETTEEQPPVIEKFTEFPETACNFVKKYEYSHVDFFDPDHKDCNYKINSYISFVPEPENEYDGSAVALYQNAVRIGYIYKGHKQDMINDYIRRDDIIMGKFDSPSTICIAFYKDIEKLPNEYDSYTYSLTGFSKKDAFETKRSENLLSCSEGDQLYLEYDEEAEKFVVFSCDGFEIGEINVNNSKKIQSLISNSDYICTIKSLELDDKISCKIHLYIKK